MNELLDNLYQYSQGDRCQIMHTAFRNITFELEHSSTATLALADIEAFLRSSMTGYQPAH